MPDTTVRCPALLISMVLETVDANGDVVQEAVTQPHKLLRKYWDEIRTQVDAAMVQVNKGQ